MPNQTPDEAKPPYCRYCKKDIIFIQLNGELSAGSCTTPNCVFKYKVYIRGPEYVHEMEIKK